MGTMPETTDRSETIPEQYRRKALYAALYHHDGVTSYAGGNTDGDPIRAEFYPEGHPDHEPGARKSIKRVAGALGFAFTSEGQFEVKLTPDLDHAMAGLQGEY